jgi:TPR repeat protein
MKIHDLERQATEGSVVAKTVLGICYLDGIQTPPDHSKAFALLNEAASLGAPRAMVGLGRMFEAGLATRRDLNFAAGWYRRAGDSGEFLGYILLARLQRAAGNHSEAAASYRRALELGKTVEECDELREARAFAAPASDVG